MTKDLVNDGADECENGSDEGIIGIKDVIYFKTSVSGANWGLRLFLTLKHAVGWGWEWGDSAH